MVGERQDYLSNVISTLVAKKLVRKGYEAYLAFISDSTSAKLFVNNIQKVMDFTDVFPDEFQGVPSTGEVEFRIDLLLGTALVFTAP